ncbi:MAG: Ig-like domain-containing protein, partial [Gammaproteobacteria bacterium]|nr:Ig-like domain-containing protein [Gammaproteobacteria bacterium]
MKIIGIMSARCTLLLAALILMLTACGGGEDNDINNLVISKTSYINAQGTQDSIFSDGQGNMSVNTIFKLTFSGDLNEKYINGSNIVLHNMNSHKQVNAKVEYDAASRTVTLLPVTLEYENHYMIRIVNAITDVNGNKLRDGKIEFSFFTEAKPALFLQEPING